MPSQYWTAPLNAPAPGAGAAYASSTTLTDVSPAPQFTFAANYLTVGASFTVAASGVFSNTATPTLLLGVYYGGVAGTALSATLATTTTTGATNWLWQLELWCNVRTVGSAGTMMSGGRVFLGTSISAGLYIPLPSVAQATVAIDTTTAKALTLGAAWGTNSASNTLTCNQFLVNG